MSELSFRMFFDAESATVEDLASIDRLVVDQSEGAAWEAQITMTLGLDEAGNWSGSRSYQLRPRVQVRVELKIGNADFAPLIEGPIVNIQSAMDARPGRSSVTVTIHDDSAWLNRQSAPISIDGQTPSQVAEQLFLERSAGHITSVEIDFPSETTPSLGAAFAEQGTAMQMLRSIAEQNGCRAYVLPGESLGTSRGIIKPNAAPPPTLPPLKLLGRDRNLLEVAVTEDPETAQSTVAHSLRLGDQQMLSYSTSERDETLLAESNAAPEPAARQLHPMLNDSEDPTARARAHVQRHNDPVQITGTLIARAYGAILSPYQVVMLQAGGSRNSLLMRVTNVTHTITPADYAVEFEGRSNSMSQLTANMPGLPTGVF